MYNFKRYSLKLRGKRMLKKFLSISALSLLTTSATFASSNADFSRVIADSNVSRAGVSVTITDLNNCKEVFKLHSKQHFHPASIQKMITYKIVENTLGKDYNFETALYKNNNNEYIIKLGADPLLTTEDLKKLVLNIQPNANAIYIDDTIIDDNNWGEGWQWDDDLNPLMPKFSAYNLDKNLIKVNIIPSIKGAPAEISQERFYPLSFVNEVITGTENKVTLKRKNYIAPDMIVISGTVKTVESKFIPINNVKRYFKLSLERILNDEKIDYSGIYKSQKVTPDYTKIASVSHSMKDIQKEILSNSSNLAAESAFKVAAAKLGEGSFEKGLELLKEYCKKYNFDISDIKIVDASGVSKNNLLTGEFVSEFLASPQNKDLKELLPTAGEGTLTNRMTYLTGKLHAKTGTLSDTSSLAGYIDSKSGATFAFCIMISDPKSKNADKKMLEEYLIREIYTKL